MSSFLLDFFLILICKQGHRERERGKEREREKGRERGRTSLLAYSLDGRDSHARPKPGGTSTGAASCPLVPFAGSWVRGKQQGHGQQLYGMPASQGRLYPLHYRAGPTRRGSWWLLQPPPHSVQPWTHSCAGGCRAPSRAQKTEPLHHGFTPNSNTLKQSALKVEV